MTKADLVEKIAKKASITKSGAERALNTFIETVQAVLLKEEKLTFTGFGTLFVETRKARKGRNPRTGDAINIPASNVVKFRAGKHLKDAIN
jgi:DNA-binding protein HU-beta